MAEYMIERRGLLGATAGTGLLAARGHARAQVRDITIQLWGTTWTESIRRMPQPVPWARWAPSP